jgi:ubiquinone biosynthesis protein UbiJ
MIEPALAAALNHLLDREPWARERLQPFVGDVLEVRAAPLPTLRLAIAENTRIEAATPSLSATLVLTLKPGFAAALMQSEAQQMRTVDLALFGASSALGCRRRSVENSWRYGRTPNG